ncbi:3946_t:CDS:2, partial [Paraglomus occultum]
VKIATIEVDEKVTQLARESKHREKELERKLAAEQAERERIEKENQKRNQELAEQLEALREASPEIVNQYTLTENSWRKLSTQEKEAYGWVTSNQGGSWQIQTEIDREKVSQSLAKKFAFTNQNFGVEAYLKEELAKKLAANEPEKKQPRKKKETPQPTATNWLTRQIAKVRQLPGATAALSIP